MVFSSASRLYGKISLQTYLGLWGLSKALEGLTGLDGALLDEGPN